MTTSRYISIINNNNNASISTVQNELSSVALTAIQTNMSLVFQQRSAKKWRKAKVRWQT